jgi:hypothetical protein
MTWRTTYFIVAKSNENLKDRIRLNIYESIKIFKQPIDKEGRAHILVGLSHDAALLPNLDLACQKPWAGTYQR